MIKQLSLRALLATFGQKLGLKCIKPAHPANQLLQDIIIVDRDSTLPLIANLDLIHPSQIQILGEKEIKYLISLGKNSLQDSVHSLFNSGSRLILICEDAPIPDLFLHYAEKKNVVLCSSPQSSQLSLLELESWLKAEALQLTHLHGVFLDVLGLGVLLIGIHNVGKSELALDLVSRGHSLIADDAPEFYKDANKRVVGSSPVLLREYLEVRGLGVLNVRAMFGDNAVKSHKNLDLIIRLQQMANEEILELDRIRGDMKKQSLFGIEIDVITLPVAPGRNLAVLVETAVRNYNLKLKGYDAAQEFIKRQQQAIDQKS